MKMLMRISRSAAIAAVFCLFAGNVYAQATRTWVSGVGDDVNPCSRTAPCKTFAGAISKTAAGGTISVLDPGGFGAVTITKSITIDAGEETGSILASGTNGVIVNAASTDTVVLRGLLIEGAGTGLNGVRLLAAKNLIIDACSISGFTQKGLDLQPTTNTIVNVNNSVIRNNLGLAAGGGINALPGATGSVTLFLENVQLLRNQFGVQVNNRSSLVARDSVVTNSQSFAFRVFASGATASATLDNVLAGGNSGTGLAVDGSGAVANTSRSAFVSNGVGMSAINSGIINTTGDNRNFGNTSNGAPTQPVTPLQ